MRSLFRLGLGCNWIGIDQCQENGIDGGCEYLTAAAYLSFNEMDLAIIKKVTDDKSHLATLSLMHDLIILNLHAGA